jgi:hydroxyacyl-ACP dehydratase HTD2-like protein with hotdog domain
VTSLDDVAVGDELPPLEKEFTKPQLFRYSAVTWNPHRIHYDTEYAREEGHPDVLVQQHMHGAVVQQLLLDWLGTDGELCSLSWRNVGRATSEQVLIVEAEVTDVDREANRIDFEVSTRTERERCAEGAASVRLFEND